MSKTPVEVTDAIRDDRPIDDERFAALVGMTRSLLETRGHPADADVAAFRDAGFTDAQVLELVLAIAVKRSATGRTTFSRHRWTTCSRRGPGRYPNRCDPQ